MSVSEINFPNGCAVIFGGSGGLGSCISALLAERGCNVVVAYNRAAERASEIVACVRASGADALAVKCSIEHSESVGKVLDSASASCRSFFGAV